MTEHHLEFRGDEKAFRAMLHGAGITETVQPSGIGKFVVHVWTGANINWWPKPYGTIHVDGKPGADIACKELLRRQPGVVSRQKPRK